MNDILSRPSPARTDDTPPDVQRRSEAASVADHSERKRVVIIHILSLPQLQNRLRVQRQWLWSYFTGQRSSRLIPEPTRTPNG